MVGTAGGEHGVRGRIDTFDVETGERRWRFYTVPGPEEFGNDTWSGDSWKTGGASIWITPSYDPELNLVYWGVGNPGPDWNPDVRLGDNLYSDSVVALDADTGKRKWHFQFTPHDVHDWDATQVMVLIDRAFEAWCASCWSPPTGTASSTCWIAKPASVSRRRNWSSRPGRSGFLEKDVRFGGRAWSRAPRSSGSTRRWPVARILRRSPSRAHVRPRPEARSSRLACCPMLRSREPHPTATNAASRSNTGQEVAQCSR